MTEQQFLNFSPGSWFITPRTLLQKIGLAEGVVLCYIWDMARYHKTTTIFMDNEEGAAKRIGIPSRKVWSAIVQRLVDKGMLSRVRKGVPARYYYTLNHKKIVELFNEDMSPEEHSDVTNRNNLLYPNVTSSCTLEGQLSKQTKKQTKKQSNEADASKVFTKFISEEFIPNYPKKIQVNRIWKQVTELIQATDTFSVEQYEELCGRIRKHLVAYVKSTDKTFLLAPDNYIAARKWEEDITNHVNKSAKNGAMNDEVNDEYLNFLKSKGL